MPAPTDAVLNAHAAQAAARYGPRTGPSPRSVWIATGPDDLNEQPVCVVGDTEAAARAAFVDVLEAYGWDTDEAESHVRHRVVTMERPICVER